MSHRLALLAGCAVMVAACTATPTGPTASAARIGRLSRTRFAAFGDSFTLGEVTAPIAARSIGPQVVVPAAAYPGVLESRLQSSYPSQAASISVANLGKGGENIIDAPPRFEEVIVAGNADVVLFQEGVNSIGYPGIAEATALTRAMVKQAKSHDLKVLVGSMLPSLAGRQRSQDIAALESYNELLREMCAQEGVTYVDLYAGLLPQADLLIGVDGLHPTEAGYRRIAELFFGAIQRELQER